MTVVGIVGGGISGLSLALALSRKGIASIVFERDSSIDARHQGYGLTLQQGAKALKAIGIVEDIHAEAQFSYSHFIFNASGNPILYWGYHPSLLGEERSDKRPGLDSWNANRNCHIPRQALRNILFRKVKDCPLTRIEWGSAICSFEMLKGQGKVEGAAQVLVKTASKQTFTVDFLVGCDGIFSRIRPLLLSSSLSSGEYESADQLNYLGVFVMLGIVKVDNGWRDLVQERVIQVSDGSARIFMMPFDEGRCMWQLSFPVKTLDEALSLAAKKDDLQGSALTVCSNMASPIDKIISSTPPSLITGYPVYDREPTKVPHRRSSSTPFPVTLIGDAAHPMSPFKGQGANQAILDAVRLSEYLYKYEQGMKSSESLSPCLNQILTDFEKDMYLRSQSKVISSREAVKTLHSPDFLNTNSQLLRRQFPDKNDSTRNLVMRLEQMANDRVGLQSASLLNEYAFGSSSLFL